jgi:uncharacterized protein (TIGR03032 family)
MQLNIPFIQLPLQFDAERLALEVTALPEAVWRPHPQGHVGNSALPLVAAYGDATNDQTRGPMRPTPHLARLPYLRQVMAALECSIGRSRLMRIDGNGEASMHVDTNYYWATHARVHVPIVTTPDVAFLCGDAEVHMAGGECWIFDTWSRHNVINPTPTRRIHLVCDVVGSAAFWHMVARGQKRDDTGAPAVTEVRAVAFDPAREADIAFELCNQPVVMSPFEIQHWRRFVMQELNRVGNTDDRHALALRSLRATLQHFEHAWTDAWSRFGIRPSGHDHFRQLLAALDHELNAVPATLRAVNGTPAAEMIRQLIVRSAVNADIAQALQDESCLPISMTTPVAANPVRAPAAATVLDPALSLRESAQMPTVAAGERPSTMRAVPVAQRFDRPIFIVCPPRSGSSLLFETLAQAPELWTIGGESHQVMETIPALNPAQQGYASNRVGAEAATATTVAELAHGFYGQLRDRDGQPVGDRGERLRFLEKTPKNALRIPFLAAAFPEARFVYLFRDARDTISSMLDAWRSRRFITYPQLPGWSGAPWSLLLTPGWREWNEKPLHEIVARQWAATLRYLVDDLSALAPDRVAIASYSELTRDPESEIASLCHRLDLTWDRPISGLPLSRHTLTPPDQEKWRGNEDVLNEVLPIVRPAIDQAAAFFEHWRGASPGGAARALPVPATGSNAAVTATARLPQAPYVLTSAAVAVRPVAPPATSTSFGSVFTASMAALLTASRSSLVVSTYQSGRTILLRADNGSINTHFKAFPSPMGIAYRNGHLALATARQVWEYQDQKGLAHALAPVGRHDACFVPRKAHVTGDIRIHEIGYAENELWIVNTRFSCLCTLDGMHSFVPRWRPAFISKIEAGDRCHLNGMSIIDDRLRYVTALANTDTAGGWREHKADGGLLIDVASNEIVARGLSMPHSPRWYDQRMWVLESGKGTLSTIDLETGAVTVVVELPGFTRGLAFHGDTAFVGLSQVRENIFGGLPLTDRLSARVCGIWAVNIRSGKIIGFLRFEGAVQEIFDVQLLPGIEYPELMEPDDERLAGLFIVPDPPNSVV